MKHLNIRSKIFGVMASLVLPLSAAADNGVTLVVCDGAGNAAKEFSLDAIRKLTFQDDGFTVMFNDAAKGSESFAYDSVGKLMFGDVSTGIADVKVGGTNGIAISYNGTMLSISGCTQPEVVRVFDISGRPVISTRVSGNAEISTENLASGVYILKVNSKTFKFSKF